MNLNDDFTLDTDTKVIEEIPIAGVVEDDIKPITVEDMFENPIPNTIPELADDFNAIASLESALIDLQYVRIDIDKTGGMCQAFALEAAKIIPEFVSVKNPLGFFTKQPSATKLRFAIEEIDKKQAGIVVAIIAAVLAICYKIYKWFTKSKEDGGGSASGGMTDKEIEKKAEDISKTAENMKNVVGKINSDSKSSNAVNDVAKEAMKQSDDSAVGKITENINGYYYDIIRSDSVIFRKINNVLVSSNLDKLLANLNTHVQVIESMAVEQIRADKIKINNSGGGTNVKNIMHNSHDLQKFDDLYKINYSGQLMTVADVFKDIKDTRSTLQDTNHKLPDFSTSLNNFVSASKKRPIVAFVNVRTRLLTLVNDLELSLALVKKRMEAGVVEITTDAGDEEIHGDDNFNGKKELLSLVSKISNVQKDISHLVNIIDTIIVDDYDKLTLMFFAAFKELKKTAEQMKKKASVSTSDNKKLEDIESFLTAFQTHFNLDEIVEGGKEGILARLFSSTKK